MIRYQNDLPMTPSTPSASTSRHAGSRRDGREPQTARQRRAAEIVRILKQVYPEATCTLDHHNPFELLVATILAAQCTDAKVNTVTPELFRRWPDAAALAAADEEALRELIHPLGFFRQKARSLVEMSRDIVALHGGEVPQTLDKLVKLRGVGRKTANVVLGECFTGGGIIVDTHCRRLSQRLGLTTEEDPTRIERSLMEVVEQADWTIYGHLMVWHGRAVCQARTPRCEECPLLALCPEGSARLAGTGSVEREETRNKADG